MRIHIWAHAQSFLPNYREQSIAWIQEYVGRLKEFGYEVSYGHSLEEKPVACEIIQIFGNGHFEIIPYIRVNYSHTIYLFPFVPCTPTTIHYNPEPMWKNYLLFLWRWFAHKNLRPYSGTQLLNQANIYFCNVDQEFAQKKILRNWGVDSNKIISIPNNPILAANEIRKLFV